MCKPSSGSQMLFFKLGYNDLHEHSPPSRLIGYIELGKKVQIVDKDGVCLFAFEISASHRNFPKPGRAAEASLKASLMNCQYISVQPSIIKML